MNPDPAQDFVYYLTNKKFQIFLSSIFFEEIWFIIKCLGDF